MTTAVPNAAAHPDRCLITVCRGCCCGNPHVQPDVDHDHLVADLTAKTDGMALLRVTGCLLACDSANVVVVSPTPRARRLGAQPQWLAGVLHPAINTAIANWISGGGPGLAPIPTSLDHRICSDPLSRGRVRRLSRAVGAGVSFLAVGLASERVVGDTRAN